MMLTIMESGMISDLLWAQEFYGEEDRKRDQENKKEEPKGLLNKLITILIN